MPAPRSCVVTIQHMPMGCRQVPHPDGRRDMSVSTTGTGPTKAISRILGASAVSALPQAVSRLPARCFAYCAFLFAACGYAIVYTLALHTGPTDLVHGLFWLCTLLILGAVQLLIKSNCRDREAALIAIVLGGLFYLPKLFRSPHFFDYHDELAHWYATEQLLAGHGAFVANPDNSIVQYYPALHVLTAALSSM